MGRQRTFPPLLKRKPGTTEARCYHAGRWWTCGRWDVEKNEPSGAAIGEWQRLIGRWTADPGSASTPKGDYLLSTLLADWGASADGPRGEHAGQLLRTVAATLGPHLSTRPDQFGPVELLAWQAALGERYAQGTVRPLRATLLAAFGWAEDAGRIAEGVAGRLERAVGRRKRRGTPGRPMRRRPPAVPEDVAACLVVLDRRYRGVAALVRVHSLLGGRVEELLGLRCDQVRRSGLLVTPHGARLDLDRENVWAAVLSEHKTAHAGGERILVFGSKCQTLLGPLLAAGRERVFDVYDRADTRERGSGTMKALRNSYWSAVKTACRRAGVTHWSPRRLRAMVADRVRDALTGEHASAYLGHGPKGVTQRHYLTLALGKAAEAARKVG